MKTEINRKQFSNILKTAKTFGANVIRINENRVIALSGKSVMSMEMYGIEGAADVTFEGATFKELQKIIGAKKTPFVTIEKMHDETAKIDEMIRLNTIDEKIDIPFSGEFQTFIIGTDVLKKAISNVSVYVSDNDNTPTLKGINMNVHGFGTEISFNATNRHYAGRYTLKGIDKSDYIASSCILDTNALKAIATLKSDSIYTIVEHSEKWTRFTIGTDVFTLQHFDSVYPNIDGVYKTARQSNLSSIRLQRTQLLDIMTTIVKLTDDKKSFITKLHYTDGTATLTDKNDNFKSEIGAHTHGINGDYKIEFNGKYMLNMLKTLNADNVLIHVHDSNMNAMWITDDLNSDSQTYEILLLPFRINN